MKTITGLIIAVFFSVNAVHASDAHAPPGIDESTVEPQHN